MSLSAFVFKGLLKTLAGQLFDQNLEFAECIGDGFGNQITGNAKHFISISVIEEDLPEDLAAVGSLVDNRASDFKETDYTFFIYIDSSRKYRHITDDIKTIFQKMLISHETCHFAFYYQLFLQLGDDLTSTLYTEFQSIVSVQLKNAIIDETDITRKTTFEEHKYEEFLRNFWDYPDSHYDKDTRTGLEYNELNKKFFRYLNEKPGDNV